MKIVLFSGLDEKTPPQNYGSVETLVYCAARELVGFGHEVIVFATEDSAEALSFCEFRAYPHLPCGMRHMNLEGHGADELKLHIMRLALQQALALEPDVIHNNDGYGVVAWNEHLFKPKNLVTTVHWPFDNEMTGPTFRRARQHNVLTISHAQEHFARSEQFDLTYCGTVHNCIAPERYLPLDSVERTESLAWVGRFDPMKGVAEAIEIAKRLDRPLVMAGKIDNYALPYFRDVVTPLLNANRGLVECFGEVSQLEASRIMASASVFLMTTKYHESFGLVVAEAFAAGTPVVATNRGAMPELIRNGIHGFVVPMRGDDIDIPRFVTATRACRDVRSSACRAWAENFRPVRMAKGYEAAYAAIVENQQISRKYARKHKR